MGRRATMGYAKDGFVGRGHIFADIAKESLRIQMRMDRANEMEAERLSHVNKIIEREQRIRGGILQRMKAGTEKHLQDLTGYRQVLKNDYRADNFTSMQIGFRRKYLYSPRTARRLKLETRIYHGGYNINYFDPEIKRKLRSVDPSTVKKVLNKVLKEKNVEESGEVIDRTLSNSDYYMKLKEKQARTGDCISPIVTRMAFMK